MHWKLGILIAVILVIIVIAYTIPPKRAGTAEIAIDYLEIVDPEYQLDHDSLLAPIDGEQEPILANNLLVNKPQTLDGSDNQVNRAIDHLNPALLDWLSPREQIRKWVLTIDLIADGKLPERYLPIDYSMGSFKVIERDGEYFADPSNYQRITALLDQVTAIDPQQIASYYQLWRSIFNKAYSELGKPGDFDQRLYLAINQVLTVKPLTEEEALKQPGVFYQYADPSLQHASPISHFMWRIGPDNALRLQQYLGQLKDYLYPLDRENQPSFAIEAQ